MKTPLSRRHFLRSSGAAILGAPAVLSAQNKGDKMRVAFIGVGGVNDRHIRDVAAHGDICAAYCDVDARNMGNIFRCTADIERGHNHTLCAAWKDANGYSDYREMFEKDADKFDAVMIGTPDHSHYPATVLAANHGKHIFTQKPLTHTVWEARQLTGLPQKGLATQMGNQGHANGGNRLINDYIRGGYLGEIKEVHCFTNRPIWPQGMQRPTGSDPVPEGLDWNVWLGPAPKIPFEENIYAPFVWRGWEAYGAGALGDMASHTMDSIFIALDPGFPTHVECLSVQGDSDVAFPESSTLKWTFGSTAYRPGFEVFWYDGKSRPARPESLPDGRELPPSGNLYIGTEATLLVTGDYGDSCRIIPEEKHKEITRAIKSETGSPRPPRLLERSPGHHTEWRMACLGEKPSTYPGSNFGYAAPFTETILLGNIALNFPGEVLTWDGPNLKFTGNEEATAMLTKEYRSGWDFKLT